MVSRVPNRRPTEPPSAGHRRPRVTCADCGVVRCYPDEPHAAGCRQYPRYKTAARDVVLISETRARRLD